MRRGTTPKNIFTTDISLVDAEVIYLTYQQNNETIFEFDKDRLEVTDEDISVTLTQEETLRLDENKRIRMQIRARFPDGSAVACEVINSNAEVILKEGVI